VPEAALSTEPLPLVRVVVVDDHAAVRAGVAGLLAPDTGFEVVGQAADGLQAVDVVRRLSPDVVLLDISMPGLDGIEALPRLLALPSPPAVVLFTAWADQPRLDAAKAGGAAGHVLKDAEPGEILAALRRASRPSAPPPPLRSLAEPVDDPSTADQSTLVRRARQGDPDAWERLYRASYPKIHAYARRRLPPAEVGDAVSETFLRAVRDLDRFEGAGAGFDAWVYGIARHVVLDAQRGSSRRIRPMRAGRELPASEPLQVLLDTEEARAARRAFGRLGPADRELLELRVIGGLSAEDAAAALGSRPGSLRMAQTRALRRLRQLLDEELGEGMAEGMVGSGR